MLKTHLSALLLPALLFLPAYQAAAKDSASLAGKGSARGRWQLGVETAQAGLSLSMMHYNKDQWQVATQRELGRVYRPVQLGLNARIQIKGLQLGFRLAAAPMHTDDRGGAEFEVNQSKNTNSYTTYLRQIQYFASVSAGKKLQYGQFGILLSAEIPLLFYSEGDYTETYSHTNYYSNSTAVNYTFQANSHYLMPSGMVYGLGARTEIGYDISDRFELGLGLSTWLLHYKFNKEIRLTYNTANASYRSDGGVNSRANASNYYALKSDAAFWMMSGILPALYVHYRL